MYNLLKAVWGWERAKLNERLNATVDKIQLNIYNFTTSASDLTLIKPKDISQKSSFKKWKWTH